MTGSIVPAQLFDVQVGCPPSFYHLVNSPIGIGITQSDARLGPATWTTHLPSLPLSSQWNDDPLKKLVDSLILLPANLFNRWEEIAPRLTFAAQTQGVLIAVSYRDSAISRSSSCSSFYGWFFPATGVLAMAGTQSLLTLMPLGIFSDSFSIEETISEVRTYVNTQSGWPVEAMVPLLMYDYLIRS